MAANAIPSSLASHVMNVDACLGTRSASLVPVTMERRQSAPPWSGGGCHRPSAMTAVVTLFGDDAEAQVLDPPTLRRLLGQGIALDAITSFPLVLRGQVCFPPLANRYSPMVIGESALIFGILDMDDLGDLNIVDLAAWWPTGGKIGTRLGIGACLGQEQIGRDGLGRADRPLPIFREPLTWLKHHRRGLVVVDWRVAAHLLSDVAVRPEDDAHGAELARRLKVRPPLFAPPGRGTAA